MVSATTLAPSPPTNGTSMENPNVGFDTGSTSESTNGFYDPSHKMKQLFDQPPPETSTAALEEETTLEEEEEEEQEEEHLHLRYYDDPRLYNRNVEFSPAPPRDPPSIQLFDQVVIMGPGLVEAHDNGMCDEDDEECWLELLEAEEREQEAPSLLEQTQSVVNGVGHAPAETANGRREEEEEEKLPLVEIVPLSEINGSTLKKKNGSTHRETKNGSTHQETKNGSTHQETTGVHLHEDEEKKKHNGSSVWKEVSTTIHSSSATSTASSSSADVKARVQELKGEIQHWRSRANQLEDKILYWKDYNQNLRDELEQQKQQAQQENQQLENNIQHEKERADRLETEIVDWRESNLELKSKLQEAKQQVQEVKAEAAKSRDNAAKAVQQAHVQLQATRNRAKTKLQTQRAEYKQLEQRLGHLEGRVKEVLSSSSSSSPSSSLDQGREKTHVHRTAAPHPKEKDEGQQQPLLQQLVPNNADEISKSNVVGPKHKHLKKTNESRKDKVIRLQHSNNHNNNNANANNNVDNAKYLAAQPGDVTFRRRRRPRRPRNRSQLVDLHQQQWWEI